MKKLISLMLALIMVFSLATVAAATETTIPSATSKAEGTADENLTFNFTKEYTGNSANASVFPAEKLQFKVTQDTADGAPTVSVEDHTVVGNPDHTIAITVGPATKIGNFNYTINEEEGKTQGVNYTGKDTEIKVTVWVYWEDVPATEEGKEPTRVMKKAVTFTGVNGAKVTEIENEYNVYDLTVTKEVDGSLASTTEEFDITVKFEVESGKKAASDISWKVAGVDKTPITAAQLNAEDGYTASFAIKHGDTVEFNNIPSGVYYTILEDAKHTLDEGETMDPNDPSSGYTASYNAAKTQLSANAVETITNVKDQEVATGIVTDSAPYIILIAVCAVAAVAFVLKRRNAVEF